MTVNSYSTGLTTLPHPVVHIDLSDCLGISGGDGAEPSLANSALLRSHHVMQPIYRTPIAYAEAS